MPSKTEGNHKFIGFAGATLTTIAFLPQAYSIYKTNDTKGLALSTYIIYFFGLLMWMVYGIIDEDSPVVHSSMVSIIIVSYIAYKIRGNQR